MRRIRAASVLTSALVCGGVLLAWGCTLARQAWRTWTRSSPAGSPLPVAEDLVVGAAGVGLAVAGGWLVLVTLACVGDLAGRAPVVVDRGVLRPGALRRAMLRACAPTVGAAMLCVAPPATATPDDPPGPVVLQGLPLPERPASAVSTDPPADPAAGQRSTSRRVELRTVLPGDCLWTITETLLGPHAAAADVARGWRALYRANRERIGADPDLVAAGTRLRVPLSLHPTRPPSR